MVVLIVSFASFAFLHHPFGSVLNLLFDDFFHITFGHTIGFWLSHWVKSLGQCTKIVLLVISELPRQLTAKQLIKPSDFRLNVIAKVWNQNCLIRAYYLLFAILTPYKSYLMVFLKSYLRRNHLFARNFDRYIARFFPLCGLILG